MTEKTPMEQWMRDTVERLGAQIGEIQGSLIDVRERLIRMETSTPAVQVERNREDIARLWARMDLMKQEITTLASSIATSNATARGWERSLDWVYKLAPWAALIVVAVSGKFSVVV